MVAAARGRRRSAAFGRPEREHAQHGHLEAGARTRRQADVTASVERHLVPELHDFRTYRRCDRIDIDAVVID